MNTLSVGALLLLVALTAVSAIELKFKTVDELLALDEYSKREFVLNMRMYHSCKAKTDEGGSRVAALKFDHEEEEEGAHGAEYDSHEEEEDHDDDDHEHIEHQCSASRTELAHDEEAATKLTGDELDTAARKAFAEMKHEHKKLMESFGGGDFSLEATLKQIPDGIGNVKVAARMRTLIEEHIDGQLADHYHGDTIDWEDLYNSKPDTKAYSRTGDNPSSKEFLARILKIIGETKEYHQKKTYSAAILKAKSRDMKMHALKYNRFAEAFAAEKHDH